MRWRKGVRLFARSRTLGGLDLEDLVLQLRAARRSHFDGLALLLAENRLAYGGLVRELLRRGVRLGGADDVVLDGLLGRDVAQPDLRADAHDVLRELLPVDHASRHQPFLELRDPVLEHRLLVLGVVVLGVLRDVAELARNADALRDFTSLLSRQVVDLFLQLLVTLWSEDHFLHLRPPRVPKEKRAAKDRPSGGRHGTSGIGGRQTRLATISRSMQVDLSSTWRIGPVEIPSRIVLAPMAGVSVQAFRRQGRRFGAGLVCSEMVSCAGLEHRNERTLGYLRIASDEHPLAVQIFGSNAATMAEAARMVEDAGADLVDINFGCPVKKVTKTGAGATLLEEPGRATAIVGAVADAVSVPVTVKMRRGLENGSRTCLDLGPRLVAAGAASLTLHPRSAKQMYMGEADHSLTAELAELVDVPVVASGDITSRAHARAVLVRTGAEAVMVGRAAQGNPWAIREIAGEPGGEPSREEVVAELVLFIRETVRELGERRATSFLKKFYGWYLGRGRFPRQFKQELTQLERIGEVEERLFAAAPRAAFLLTRLEQDYAPAAEVELDLPISIYGGG